MFHLRVLFVTAMLACDAEEKDTGGMDTDGDGVVSGDTGAEDSGIVDTGSNDTPPDLDALTEEGGCSDIMFTLSSPDGDLVLVFSKNSTLTQEAFKTGKPVTVSLSLPTDGMLALHRGNQAADFYCNDAISDTMVIDQTWTATTGAVTITVTSDGIDHGHGGIPGTGTITIEGAILTTDGADDVSISDLSWAASVGWLPG